jgi:peptidoglycan L-alanyl-D-glutamate endopeptidase CwlK
MIDSKTLDRIKLLHPKVREEVGDIYNDISKALTGKAFCRFTSTLRTFAEQDALYAKGRTAPGGIVTNARGGLSMHNYGLAIDIVLVRDGSALWDVKADLDGDGKADWIEIVTIFKSYGWEWGGDWKFYDAPHFQKSFGKSIRELLALHKANKVDGNGFVRI